MVKEEHADGDGKQGATNTTLRGRKQGKDNETYRLKDTYFFFLLALRPNTGKGLLINEVARSHNDAPQSVGLLWTSDQPVAETST